MMIADVSELRDSGAIRAEAETLLSRYIQFDTTNPPGNEWEAAQWLAGQLRARVTEDITIFEPVPGRGLLIARIAGSDPLKPLLINHHIDVVAADPARWTHPPFSGDIAGGYVWGRGTLDTKGLGIMFMLALQKLLAEGVRFRRPVIYTAVPDEETGGSHGTGWLVEHHLQELDPEWVWDEGAGGIRGLFGKKTFFGIMVAEKQLRQYRLVATGVPGHGSMPHRDNAAVTLLSAVQRVVGSPRRLRLNAVAASMFEAIGRELGFPTSLLLRGLRNPVLFRLVAPFLARDSTLNATLRDTISLTVLAAGYKTNVIPERAEAEIDCRLLPDTDGEEFERWLRGRIKDRRVRLEPIEISLPSGTAPVSSPFYAAVAGAIARHAPGTGVFPLQMPGATDSRYFRTRGYPAYGFAPSILDRADLRLPHGIDERISSDNLVLGVEMCADIIRTLCAE